MMKESVKLCDLSIGYRFRNGGDKVVLRGLNSSLAAGELTCLLGLNGSGKSTLLRTLCRFQDPLEGKVLLNGEDIALLSPKAMAENVAVVLTERTSGSGLTVREVVSLGRYPYTGYFGTLSAGDERIIDESLSVVGMLSFASQYLSSLSDGEKQKVLIAKALAQGCPVIILDEPTSFLDISSRTEVFLLLKKLALEGGKSILLSTHDVDLARKYADRWWLLGNGALHVGPPEELIVSGTAPSLFNRGPVKVF